MMRILMRIRMSSKEGERWEVGRGKGVFGRHIPNLCYISSHVVNSLIFVRRTISLLKSQVVLLIAISAVGRRVVVLL